MQSLVERYNERKEDDALRSEVYEEMAEHLTNLIWEVQKEFSAGDELGIDFEEKAFYDILKDLCVKYDFKYPEDKLIVLAQAVKDLVDSQIMCADRSNQSTSPPLPNPHKHQPPVHNKSRNNYQISQKRVSPKVDEFACQRHNSSGKHGSGELGFYHL